MLTDGLCGEKWNSGWNLSKCRLHPIKGVAQQLALLSHGQAQGPG